MHGDYHWNNVLFARDRPARIVAVVDWEQATIGDPLLDLGWLLALWDQAGEDSDGRESRGLFSQESGVVSRVEVVQTYALRSGRSMANINYYRVLALFKMACILEGSYARFVTGESRVPGHTSLAKRVPALVLRASHVIGSTEFTKV
jgi:aminoglycoside phosphotransferase (APT) family kinase protein